VRRPTVLITAAVALSVIIGGTATGASAAVATNPVPMQRLLPPAPGGVYLGAHSVGLETRDGEVLAWGKSRGRTVRIAHWYQHWLTGQTRFRPDWATRVARQGAVPMITWEPWKSYAGRKRRADQPAVRLARIAGGHYDRYIRSWGRSVAAYRGPVMIRLMHEMNGTWYPWGLRVNGNTPALYRAAFRHVHRIFDRQGARNVSWVWSINNLNPGADTTDIAAAYPGDRYVDWVATSGFNWGDAFSWSDWRDADALFRPSFDFLGGFHKPIMISEIGTTGIGGDRPAWIPATISRLRTAYPNLSALVWYSAIDGSRLDFRLRGATRRSLARASALNTWVRTPRFAPVSGGR
jgi:Glycosyl hydrolase family 26